ncbi:unnamed protein product, partial [Ectocarpus sp. 12 AP-2014]
HAALAPPSRFCSLPSLLGVMMGLLGTLLVWRLPLPGRPPPAPP